MPDQGSFPALERLREEAEGLDLLVEHTSPAVGAWIEWAAGIDYASRKRELLEERRRVRGRYQDHRGKVERTYGTAVVRALERRRDGEQPRFDLERVARELDDASAELDELYEAVDEAYLTRQERRQLAELESDLTDAREYVRNKREFDRRRAALEPAIERFEELFAPYAGGERYMISSDEAALVDRSHELWTGLASLARELVLPVLPSEDADWLADRKTRFGELADQLPQYNEQFVAAQREEHADLLETAYGPLNEQQQKAVVRDDRRNLVDASAGTGKTLTLTYRFIYLLETGVSPSDIAAVTYTSDAAAEMTRRIAAATDVAEADLNVSTIHAFAGSIYHEARGGGDERELGEARTELVETYLDAADRGQAASTADVPHPDCYEAFADAYREFRRVEVEHGGPDDDGYVDANRRYTETADAFVRRKFESFVEKARTFDRSAAEIRAELDGTDEVRDSFGEAGAALVEAYGRIVEADAGPTDFDDMIYTATAVVESNPERFGDRFKHLLVDEFQDVTDATLSFVESFTGGKSETHLFCVGDDWQAIYGFNGSNVRYFTEYGERFDDVTLTQLSVNYRCPPAVVDAGTALMAGSSADQNEKDVVADSDLETTPTVHTLDGLYDRRVVPYVVEMIESELADRSPDEVMVLSRNDAKSQYMSELRTALEERGIPHRRPKHERDHLPASYRDSLPYPVTFDDEGFAEYDVPAGGEAPDEGPPIVRTQSIHSSKGTEAPVVILLHAVDDDPDGIPKERRTDLLTDPATDVTAEHVPEERRLCYVALTRTEEAFHAVAETGRVSRFLEELEGRLRWEESPVPETLVGRCTRFRSPEKPNYPYKATLDCGAFAAPLLAWPDQELPTLEEGATYRVELTDLDWELSRSEYGDEIRFDRASVERVDDAVAADEDD